MKKPTTAQLKSNALNTTGNLIIITATLAVAATVARLLGVNAGLFEVTAIVAMAFGADDIATRLVNATLGRTRQRLHASAGCTDCADDTSRTHASDQTAGA